MIIHCLNLQIVNAGVVFRTLINIYDGTFLKLGFTPCKAEQPLGGMEVQDKEEQRD